MQNPQKPQSLVEIRLLLDSGSYSHKQDDEVIVITSSPCHSLESEDAMVMSDVPLNARYFFR